MAMRLLWLALGCLLIGAALLTHARSIGTLLTDPNDAVACTSTEPPPMQEKMPLPQRIARRARFRKFSSASQPTLHELLAAAPPYERASASVTVILNHWKRRTLCRQLEALLRQTVRPAHLWVCLFASPMAASARAAALAYNDSRIAVFESPTNFKYFGRFQLAMSAKTAHVWLIDDDVIPGERFLHVLLRAAAGAHASHALLGSIGWLLPEPDAAGRLASYRSRANGSGGLYVPDLAYDLLIERAVEVDYLCSMWFARTAWLHLLFREPPPTYETAEDFHLSHMLRKYAAVRSLALPVAPHDRTTWGDTEHALAYARYSTGGRRTIELRDRVWWRGVQRGAALHWAAARGGGGGRGALLLLSRAADAAALRPFADGGAALVLAGDEPCERMVAPLGLPAAACVERRLRLFDMRLAEKRRARAHAAALAHLRPIALSYGATLLVSRAPDSAGSWAAGALARLVGLPHLRLPEEASAAQVGLLAALPPRALAQWPSLRLHLALLPHATATSRSLASLSAAAAGALGASLGLHAAPGGGGGGGWAHGAVRLRARVGGAACDAVERAESWHPSAAAGGEGREALVLLDGGAQLSGGALIFVKAALLSPPEGQLLGVGLGVPLGAEARRGALAAPSACGAAFFGSGWVELQAFAAEQLASGCVDWGELLLRFMRATGYRLHFPGVSLCRPHGDNATRLATEEDLAALLRDASP